MELNNKNRVYLPGLEQCDDFERVVGVLTGRLGWTEQERWDGLDGQIATFRKGPYTFTLAYNEMLGMDIKCEGDELDLPRLAREILEAL